MYSSFLTMWYGRNMQLVQSRALCCDPYSSRGSLVQWLFIFLSFSIFVQAEDAAWYLTSHIPNAVVCNRVENPNQVLNHIVVPYHHQLLFFRASFLAFI
jgi:hypothetical protein